MKRQSTYLSASPAETERIAAEIAADVRPGDYIALFGEMGAGKTAFTRGLIAALAPECLPLVHSPTFAIVNEYRGGNVTVYHFDLYRIEDEDDLYSTGFFDYLDLGGVLALEWSENIDGALPEGTITITFERLGDESRSITIEGGAGK